MPNSKPVWWCGREGKKIGPFSAEKLRQMAQQGELLPQHRIWREGRDRWVPACVVRGLFPEGVQMPQMNRQPEAVLYRNAFQPTQPLDDFSSAYQEDLASEAAELGLQNRATSVNQQPALLVETQASTAGEAVSAGESSRVGGESAPMAAQVLAAARASSANVVSVQPIVWPTAEQAWPSVEAQQKRLQELPPLQDFEDSGPDTEPATLPAFNEWDGRPAKRRSPLRRLAPWLIVATGGAALAWWIA